MESTVHLVTSSQGDHIVSVASQPAIVTVEINRPFKHWGETMGESHIVVTRGPEFGKTWDEPLEGTETHNVWIIVYNTENGRKDYNEMHYGHKDDLLAAMTLVTYIMSESYK